MSFKALSRRRRSRRSRAQRIKLGVGLPQFAVDDTQPGKQRTQMNAGCLGHALANFDGRLLQVAKHSGGVDAADVVVLEQFLDRRRAQPVRSGRRGREIPQIENPRRRHVAVGDLQHLRIVPPQLMMHAVAQPDAFLVSSSARRDHARNSTSRGSVTCTRRNRRRSVRTPSPTT